MDQARWHQAIINPAALDVHVVQEIHPDDGMLGGDLPYYQSVGRDAARLVSTALLQAQRARGGSTTTPARILDFACGYGRVGRYLRACFPDADIAFSDLASEASAFCARAFSGRQVPVDEEFTGYAPGAPCDLIWVGSLFTHLRPGKSARLFDLLYGLLAPGGLLVMTMCGRYVAARRDKATSLYNLDLGDYDAMVEQARDEGYGFAPYARSPDYGLSVALPRWWQEQAARHAASEVVYFSERGWIRHQDVVAILRTS